MFKLQTSVSDGELSSFRQGFHITFANDWTVSVQFGSGSYCDNRDFNDSGNLPPNPCPNAEIGIFHKGSRLISFSDGETVRGWIDPDQLLKYMNWVAKLPNHPDAAEGVIPEL